MKKKKLLIFHPVLATYRVDQFNELNNMFDLTVVFLFDNMWNYKMNQDKLISECKFDQYYLLKGFNFNGRVFRYGIYKMIKKIKPDIVMSYEYSLTTQYIILLKKFGIISQEVGITTDDSLDFCYNVQSRTRLFFRNKSVSKLDFLVVLSKEVAEFYKERFNIKDHQIIISPILQDSNKLRKISSSLKDKALLNIKLSNLSEKKVLLFVGRLIQEKALAEFLTNISNLLSDSNDTIFIIVGDGKEKMEIESVIKNKKLENKVLFTGKLEGDDVRIWYLSASGLVLPSISEAFGAVVNEALIYGIPVLCSEYAGASSLIDYRNGLVFNPLNIEETILKTSLFIKQMKPVSDIEFKSKPSLMGDYKQQLYKEWSKLQNV